MLTAIRAEHLYDGLSNHPLPDRTVIINNGRIDSIQTGEPALPAEVTCLNVPVVAPGFIDMQINGAGDRLFNDAPTVETITTMASAARQGGTAYILPTFITSEGIAYQRAIDAVSTAIDQRQPGILGIHLEGPFLNPKRPGIHPAAGIRPITPDDLDHLTACQHGTRLITLAPEDQPAGTTGRLAAAGWTVFAGHSEATHQDIINAKQDGLSGVTHLFNAMGQITPREPGLVGSALDDPDLFAGIIADGHHVHPANLRLAAAGLGPERLCLITDAMPTLGGARTSIMLGDKKIHLQNGRLADADGTLAGAHLSMIDAVRNMIRFADIPLASALRMASTAPAKALGLDHELGRIAPGFRASLTLLDEALAVQGVIVDGRTLE